MTNSDSEEQITWLQTDPQIYRSKSSRRESSSTVMDFDNHNENSTSGCFICNPQICLSYFLSIFSSLIIVHGFWLWYTTRNNVWFILPSTGVAMIFIGACLYSSGHSNLLRTRRANALGRGRVQLRNKNRRFSRRNAQRQSFFESSNLSLNMLPQCFNQHSSNARYLMLGTMSSTNDINPSQNKSRVAVTSLDHPSTSTSMPLQSSVIEHTIPIESNTASSRTRDALQFNNQQPDRPPPTYEQVLEADQSNFQTL